MGVKSNRAVGLSLISANSLSRAGRNVEARLWPFPLAPTWSSSWRRSDWFCCFPEISASPWDITYAELRGRAAYDFYFNGFDSDLFDAEVPAASRYYGPLADLLITIAQQSTSDAVQRFEIRTVLQAAISLSCPIPIFLIAARVVSKPLALVAVILVAATPAFFGHAFINPKDSVFASAFLWALYLILVCFEMGEGLATERSSALGCSSGWSRPCVTSEAIFSYSFP